MLTGARRGRWCARVGPMMTLGEKGGASVAPLFPPLATSVAWPSDLAQGRPPSSIAGPRLAPSKDAQREAAKRIDRFYEVAEPVWVACNMLWIFVCCVAPAIVFWRGLAGTWPALLITGLAILGFILVTFWHAHRGLYPDASDERRSKTLLMGVSPLGAIRAVDYLSHRALAGTDPIIAAIALCPRDEAVRLARWLYFVPDHRDAGLRQFLESSDLWDEVVAPPHAGETGATAFCPRCHAQYVRADGTCSDCSGVELVKWAPGAPTPSAVLSA
ncbi:MAG: hypothetical protein ACRD1S_12785 [Vicinamibacterales bacterium]